MRSSLFQLALSAMAGIQSVMAMGPPPPLPPPDELDTAAFRMLNDPQSPSSGKATFDQYIDHKNPSLGTFPQTYWYVDNSYTCTRLLAFQNPLLTHSSVLQVQLHLLEGPWLARRSLHPG